MITKHGHGCDLGPIRVLEAGHPVPDETSVAAGAAMLDLASKCGLGDLVIFVLSGGASALMEAPAPGQTLESIAAATMRTMNEGADIHRLNAVRSQMSAIKGGKLADAFGDAEIVCLVMSDVAGNDFRVIGSGPLFRPGVAHILLADSSDVAWAAVMAAQKLNLAVAPPASIHGEARVEAERLLRAALKVFDSVEVPACAIAVGETVVHVRGTGRGGRCQEFACASANLIAGRSEVAVLAGSTDGTDGPTEFAGGLVDGDSSFRADVSPQSALDNNDSSAFLAACDGLIVTGPTQCNLNDVYLVVRMSGSERVNEGTCV